MYNIHATELDSNILNTIFKHLYMIVSVTLFNTTKNHLHPIKIKRTVPAD